MAKKQVKKTEVVEDVVTPQNTETVEVKQEDLDKRGEACEQDMCMDTLLPVRSIEICTITELVAYEAASRLVCSKYELRSRLDGENNEKFKKFADLHSMIIDELERRVVRACELPKTI